MKKSLLLLLFIFVLLISFGCNGCSKKQLNSEEILDKLKDLESYSCSMDIKVKNSKQTIEYLAKELYCRGVGYKVELGGDRVFLYKSDKIYVEDLKNNSKYILDRSFDQVFKYSFIGDYIGLLYSNEKITYKTYTETDVNYLGIELTLPGNNRNLSRAVLYIEQKTVVPVKVVIYDSKNKESIVIVYSDFKVNEPVTIENR